MGFGGYVALLGLVVALEIGWFWLGDFRCLVG
jgi:hypothetical protein